MRARLGPLVESRIAKLVVWERADKPVRTMLETAIVVVVCLE